MLGWSGYLNLVISLVFAKLNKREKAQVCGATKALRVLLHHVYMCVLILGQGLHNRGGGIAPTFVDMSIHRNIYIFSSFYSKAFASISGWNIGRTQASCIASHPREGYDAAESTDPLVWCWLGLPTRVLRRAQDCVDRSASTLEKDKRQRIPVGARQGKLAADASPALFIYVVLLYLPNLPAPIASFHVLHSPHDTIGPENDGFDASEMLIS